MALELKPMTRREAFAFIRQHHSHHKPPTGYKFAIGAVKDNQLVGVIIAGRPVARGLDDGYTIEITRCCTDRTKNVSSKLYGAAVRSAREMGYRRFMTYIREDETGDSLRASGWLPVYDTKAKSWDTPSRKRTDKTEVVPRQLWSPAGRFDRR